MSSTAKKCKKPFKKQVYKGMKDFIFNSNFTDLTPAPLRTQRGGILFSVLPFFACGEGAGGWGFKTFRFIELTLDTVLFCQEEKAKF